MAPTLCHSDADAIVRCKHSVPYKYDRELTAPGLRRCHQDFTRQCFNTGMTNTLPNSDPKADPDRAQWMSLLARSPASLLSDVAGSWNAMPSFTWLRRPEIGLAMVRGRTGGTGAQFNLGEMSVTRCALRIDSGEMGVAYVTGRNPRHAELAALFDALMQTAAATTVRSRVLQPIAAALAAHEAQTRARAQATRVDFMTMVRGEDA